jgi:HNH endonuclease
MSAFPPKADIVEHDRDVRFVPNADIDGLRGPLAERFGIRQKLCRIPSIVRLMPFSSLVGRCLPCVSRIFWLPMLSAKRLRKVLSYAPTTGIFRWKVSASSRAPVGAIAGAKNGRGYHQIRIGGRPYSASRLAWLYMTGKWPNSEISYINGKPSDARWANLREATSSQNRSRPKRNS